MHVRWRVELTLSNSKRAAASFAVSSPQIALRKQHAIGFCIQSSQHFLDQACFGATRFLRRHEVTHYGLEPGVFTDAKMNDGMFLHFEFVHRRSRQDALIDLHLLAHDVADLLVRRGVPFREAHGIVGGVVRAAVERGKKLSELTEEELKELAPQLDGQFYELLDEGSWLESKVSDGGTAMSRVRDQLAQARQVLREAGR